MCDRPHFEDLESRVDGIDTRLSVVENTLGVFRDENRRGFDDLKAEIRNIYAERAEWGKTARAIVHKVVLWLMWLIPALCGLHFLVEYFK